MKMQFKNVVREEEQRCDRGGFCPDSIVSCSLSLEGFKLWSSFPQSDPALSSV